WAARPRKNDATRRSSDGSTAKMTPVTTPRDTRMMKEIRATESRPICQEDPKPTAWYVANFALSQPVTMAPRIGGGAPAASLRCKMSHYFGTFYAPSGQY